MGNNLRVKVLHCIIVCICILMAHLAHAVPIDDFKKPQDVMVTTPNQTLTAGVNNFGSLGGARKLVTGLHSGTAARGIVSEVPAVFTPSTSRVPVQTPSNFFAYQSSSGSLGHAALVWDGTVTQTLSNKVLKGVNLGIKGEKRFKLNIKSFQFKDTLSLSILVYNRVPPLNSRSPQTIAVYTSNFDLNRDYTNETIDIPFSKFKSDPTSNIEPVFNDVSGIILFVTGSTGSNIIIDCFETSSEIGGVCKKIPPFVCGPELLADADFNCCVDTKDFDIWKANFQKTGTTFTQGDFNGDGTVDAADFSVYASNVGKGCATPTPGATLTGIASKSPTPVLTVSPTITGTRTASATSTVAATPSKTITPNFTSTAVNTATATKTGSPTASIPTPIFTLISTQTPVSTPTPNLDSPPVWWPVERKEIYPPKPLATLQQTSLDFKSKCHAAEVYTLSAGKVVRVPSATHTNWTEPAWKVDLGQPEYKGRFWAPSELYFTRVSGSKKTLWVSLSYLYTAPNNAREVTAGLVRIDISDFYNPKILDQVLGLSLSPDYDGYFDDEAAYYLSHGMEKVDPACEANAFIFCPSRPYAKFKKLMAGSQAWTTLQNVDLRAANNSYWRVIATDPQSWPYILVGRMEDTVHPTREAPDDGCFGQNPIFKQSLEVSLGKISPSGSLEISETLESREYKSNAFTHVMSKSTGPDTGEVFKSCGPAPRPGAWECYGAEMLNYSNYTQSSYAAIENGFSASFFSYDHLSGTVSYIANLRPSYTITHKYEIVDTCGYMGCESPGCGLFGCTPDPTKPPIRKGDRKCFQTHDFETSKIEFAGDPFLKQCEVTYAKDKSSIPTCDGVNSAVVLQSRNGMPEMEGLAPYRSVYSIPVDDINGANRGRIQSNGSIQKFYRAADGNYVAVKGGELASIDGNGDVKWSQPFTSSIGKIFYFQEKDPSIFYLPGIDSPGYPPRALRFLPETLVDTIQKSSLDPAPIPVENLPTVPLGNNYISSVVGCTKESDVLNDDPRFLVPYNYNAPKAIATWYPKLAVETRKDDPDLPSEKHLNRTELGCSGGVCQLTE